MHTSGTPVPAALGAPGDGTRGRSRPRRRQLPGRGRGAGAGHIDAAGIVRVLRAVLGLLPVDDFEPDPLIAMQVVGSPEIRRAQRDAGRRRRGSSPSVPIVTIERFEFYARAREAYAVFATGEREFYGNLIIRKGVIPPTARRTSRWPRCTRRSSVRDRAYRVFVAGNQFAASRSATSGSRAPSKPISIAVRRSNSTGAGAACPSTVRRTRLSGSAHALRRRLISPRVARRCARRPPRSARVDEGAHLQHHAGPLHRRRRTGDLLGQPVARPRAVTAWSLSMGTATRASPSYAGRARW